MTVQNTVGIAGIKKSCPISKNKKEGLSMNPYEFMQKQSLPYEAKLAHAEVKAREFYERMEGGGLL